MLGVGGGRKEKAIGSTPARARARIPTLLLSLSSLPPLTESACQYRGAGKPGYWAICTIEFNGLHRLVRLCCCSQWVPFSGASTDSVLPLFPLQHASAKSKNQTKTGTTPRRNPAWCSRTSNAEPSLPSSRRISARLKRCRSPFPSSWAWSSPPSATSSWTPGAAAWRSGRTTWAPGAPRPPPTPAPKHDGRTLSWAQVTSRRGQQIPKADTKEKRHRILSWGPSLVIWKHNSLEKKLLAVIIGQVFFFILFLMAMESTCKLKMNLVEPDIVLWACWASQKPKWGLPGASSFWCGVNQAQDCLKYQQSYFIRSCQPLADLVPRWEGESLAWVWAPKMLC